MAKRMKDIEFHLKRNYSGNIFPLDNLWIGVTAENQKQYDLRWSIASQIPAAVLWVSHEPALGPIDYSKHERKPDWWVTGGESGPGARPMHPDIPRFQRDQCQSAGVPFFMKQMSGKTKAERYAIPDDLMRRDYPSQT